MKNGWLLFLFFSVQLTSQTVDELTGALTKNAVNDSIKVLNIYAWVTNNIVYDHHFLRYRANGDTALLQEPYNVVVKKKAICIGYAKLIRTMCQKVGIQAVLVDGFAKPKNDDIDHDEHAWNAVKFNGRWHLLDATWDAGVSQSLQKYRMPPPSVFLETHYPHDPIWQLTDEPINFDCFKKNRLCVPNKFVFNYRDTLDALGKMDTLARMMDVGQRTLRFYPSDLDALRNLANGHSGYAVNAYNDYAKIRADVVARRNVLLNQQEVWALLDAIDFHLTQARDYYERLITFARNGTYTDAHINRDMMVENLMKLEKERKFVLQYIKK